MAVFLRICEGRSTGERLFYFVFSWQSSFIGSSLNFRPQSGGNLDLISAGNTAFFIISCACSTVAISLRKMLPSSYTDGKYREINKVSKPTATRDLQELNRKRILENRGKKGAGAAYVLIGS
jgi:hypothetical protein